MPNIYFSKNYNWTNFEKKVYEHLIYGIALFFIYAIDAYLFYGFDSG